MRVAFNKAAVEVGHAKKSSNFMSILWFRERTNLFNKVFLNSSSISTHTVAEDGGIVKSKVTFLLS